MLWPALVAHSHGELTPDQTRLLLTTLQLEDTPRAEGPGAAGSIAHRSFAGDSGTRLVVDVARIGDDIWALGLFFDGEPPSKNIVEHHRRMFRDVIDRLELTLIQVEPAATGDEVSVMPPQPDDAESPMDAYWPYPDLVDLDDLWLHLRLRKDAPRKVKAVKLREVMSYPSWAQAHPSLQRQAEEFLTRT
ncbi:hypothetical protein [Marinactinospora rubrisoli]|uniref:Uncharacterized protein n=1 Tax=Marinactinospora rubrisoli TaxID=2715399 RepID=A0ABW2KB71_9ACTN